MMYLIQDGTISLAQIQPTYVGGPMPLIDIIYIWGPRSSLGINKEAALTSQVAEASNF